MKKLLFVLLPFWVWMSGVKAEKYQDVVLETNQGVIRLKV